MTTTKKDLDVRRVGGWIGAEIPEVRLSGDMDDSIILAIREALLAHKVLFFRDQHHLDPAGHTAFARRFGQLTAAPPAMAAIADTRHILEFDNTGGIHTNHWHIDVSFVDRPPAISILRTLTVPLYGGDTVWANTAAAYQALPEVLRRFVDQLRVIHSNVYDYLAQHIDPTPQAIREHEDFTSTVFETEHPVVRVHPETGERSLLLGGFARQIIGLSVNESTHVLQMLHDRIVRLENTVRWRWTHGDVAMWDNRATQHYAIADYGTLPRRVQRITVAGDTPVGVDGRASVIRRGDTTGFSPAHPPTSG